MNTSNQLSREALECFKTMYQDEFGEQLTDDHAREIATNLLHFFGVVTQGRNLTTCPPAR